MNGICAHRLFQARHKIKELLASESKLKTKLKAAESDKAVLRQELVKERALLEEYENQVTSLFSLSYPLYLVYHLLLSLLSYLIFSYPLLSYPLLFTLSYFTISPLLPSFLASRFPR